MKLSIDLIDVADVALRGAQVKHPNFQHLVESLQMYGQIDAITVRPNPDVEGRYILINGLQRYTAAKQLGWDEIEVAVKEEVKTKLDSLLIQIASNLQHIETKPVEVGRVIQQWMQEDRTLTLGTIAAKIGRPVVYVTDRLNISKTLTQEVADKVDNGSISVVKAVRIAKLPTEEQENYATMASDPHLSCEQFLAQINARLEEIKAKQNKGERGNVAEFQIIPKPRSKNDILNELECKLAASRLITDEMSPITAFELGLQYAIGTDPETVKVNREKWEADQKAKAEKAAQDLAKREQEKAAKAAGLQKKVSLLTADE